MAVCASLTNSGIEERPKMTGSAASLPSPLRNWTRTVMLRAEIPVRRAGAGVAVRRAELFILSSLADRAVNRAGYSDSETHTSHMY